MPVISNAGDQPENLTVTKSKNPAAVALGRLGGKAGTGASKRRTRETYAKMVAAKRERRDCALEVLGALIEAEAALFTLMDAPYRDVDFRDDAKDAMNAARERAALAIERATGQRPGLSTDERTV